MILLSLFAFILTFEHFYAVISLHPFAVNQPLTRQYLPDNTRFQPLGIGSGFRHQCSRKFTSIVESKSFPHFVAGLVAGLVECLVGHPLDTIRIIIMADKSPLRKTTMSLLTATLSSPGGLLSLYRGSASELLSAGLAGSVEFGVNDCFKRYFGKSREEDEIENIDGVFCVAAFGVGLLDGITSKPLEMIKLRQQIAGFGRPDSLHHMSFGQCARVLLKEGGPAGFFRGWIPTTLRESLGNLAFFLAYQKTRLLMYDTFAKHIGPRELESTDLVPFKSQEQQQEQHQQIISVRNKKRFDNGVILLAGAMAGLAYVLSSYPFETAAVLMQTDVPSKVWGPLSHELAHRFQYSSMQQCLRHVIREQGVGALYKGLGPTIARALPAYAASLWGYEATLTAMEKIKKRRKIRVALKLQCDASR